MLHLGDITKINWAEVEPVDCVTGGSPCQDLSVAGKRAGLAGERSGLYMEQIRCVKELREQDVRNGRTGKFIRPRYMVWENVPGAFSSNGGKDFAAVLEEAVKIAEPEAADVPVPEKGWPSAGCLYDEMGRWSVAWRVHDAQFWGVPQRRKRISLVCDFGGLSAPEVLFERKGLSGDFEQSRAEGQGTAQSPEGSTDSANGCLTSWDCQSKRIFAPNGICATFNSGGREGKNITPSVPCLNDQGGSVMAVSEEVSGCLRAQEHGHQPAVCYGFKPKQGAKAGNIGYRAEQSPTLNAEQEAGCLTIAFVASGFGKYKEGVGTLRASGGDYGGGTETLIKIATIRRLTPTECERLQGYPDGWTDIGEWVDSKGKKHKEADSPRYKALGNSIALPFWKWLLKRISAQYERDATLGSLFDGIGGFPLCWEQINGKGSARWASEIEEFPMAVTRKRFGNDQL